MDDKLQSAIHAWTAVVGECAIFTDPDSLDRANQTTFRYANAYKAKIEPRNRKQLVECVRIAQRYGVPIYPISRGYNWGYGSRNAPSPTYILLSLSRLADITEFNETLAYVTLEPGVSFKQLAEFLQQQRSSLLAPIIGSSPEASVLGNTLERGIGKGLYEDMSGHVVDYEILKADGEIVHTSAHPLGTSGPSLHGLFQQSNLGIVIGMTFHLEPAPLWRQEMVFGLQDHAQLNRLAEQLRTPLIRDGGKRFQLEMMNDYRFATQTHRFPYDSEDGTESLSSAWLRHTLRGFVDGRWVGLITLWSDSEEERNMRLDHMDKLLRPYVNSLYTLEQQPGNSVQNGSPESVQSAYWRKRGQIPSPDAFHPDRDGCGVIWLTPVLPMLGSALAEAVEIIERIVIENGLEPALSLRCVKGRTAVILIGLFYDRAEETMEQRALNCRCLLKEAINRLGYPLYRKSLLDLKEDTQQHNLSKTWLHEIKSAIDPRHIIAPGRYIPSAR